MTAPATAATVRGDLSLRLLSVAAGTVGVVGVPFALARLLDTADLGSYLLSMTLLTLAPMITRLGVADAALRDVARHANCHDLAAAGAYAWAAGGFVVRAGLPLAAAMASAMLVTPSGTLLSAVLVALLLFGEAIRSTASDIMRALGYIRSAIMMSPQVRISLHGALLVSSLQWASELSLSEALAIALALDVALTVCSVCLTSRVMRLMGCARARRTELPTGSLRQLGRYGAPFVLMEVGIFVVMRGDMWIAGLFLDPREAGTYAAASITALYLLAPLNAVNFVMAPRLATGIQEALVPTERLARTYATVSFAGTALVGVFLSFFGDGLLTALYGAEYGDSHGILVLKTVGVMVAGATGSCGLALAMSGMERRGARLALSSAVAAAFLYVGAALLGPSYIALVAALALGLLNVAFAITAARELGFRSWIFVPRNGLSTGGAVR